MTISFINLLFTKPRPPWLLSLGLSSFVTRHIQYGVFNKITILVYIDNYNYIDIPSK